jgi:hypothetical protein
MHKNAQAELCFDSSSDVVAMSEMLRTRGVVCIRNLIAPEALAHAREALHANARQMYRLLGREVNDLPLCFADRSLAGLTPPPSLAGSMEMREYSDPLTHSGMTPAWFYEGERNFKRWFWEHGARFPNTVLRCVLDSILPRICRQYFGEGFVSAYHHNTVRYQRAEMRDKSYAFHQDGSYHSREALEHTSLTAWIPFADCGVDAPGLELFPYKLKEVLPLPTGKSMPYLFCDEEEVLRRFGSELWAPSMRAGDVLLFDGFTIHRSHITSTMTRERGSADIRVFPRSRPPQMVKQAVGWVMEVV